MLSQAKFEKRHSYYDTKVKKKQYSIAIPCTNSSLKTLNSYYDKVYDLTTGFNQNRITSNDVFLINDILGLSNSGHKHAEKFDED